MYTKTFRVNGPMNIVQKFQPIGSEVWIKISCFCILFSSSFWTIGISTSVFIRETEANTMITGFVYSMGGGVLSFSLLRSICHWIVKTLRKLIKYTLSVPPSTSWTGSWPGFWRSPKHGSSVNNGFFDFENMNIEDITKIRISYS